MSILDLTITDRRRPAHERDAILTDPGFGRHFTDHMVTVDWSAVHGWHDARLTPYAPLAMDPAAAVLHYGQQIFEGLKAYHHEDGSLWLFRPDLNAERLQRSARRLALPEVPTELFLDAVRALVRADRDWVPSGGEASLYLRPFVIANENFLGVRAAGRAAFHVIATPAGSYFTGGVTPVTLWVSTDHTRAGRGGTGAAKTGANYAASLAAQAEAQANGCAQVLFLDAQSGTTIEEAGSMNVMLVRRDRTVVTPRLSGTILDGVTRNSALHLLRDRGFEVIERDVTLDEWRFGVETGEIVEAFATGTAAVITPIAALKSPGGFIGDPAASAGELTLSLREELTGMQFGRVGDRHGWLVPAE